MRPMSTYNCIKLIKHFYWFVQLRSTRKYNKQQLYSSFRRCNSWPIWAFVRRETIRSCPSTALEVPQNLPPRKRPLDCWEKPANFKLCISFYLAGHLLGFLRNFPETTMPLSMTDVMWKIFFFNHSFKVVIPDHKEWVGLGLFKGRDRVIITIF